MGERTSYELGTFSWADLATTDPAGAKAFYAGLFGWEFDDMPVGGGGTYTMCRVDGKHVAALSGQRDEERDHGVPPHWNSYVTVHDIDARASRITELNGTLMMPPFDVMDAGRMAVAIDPTGAVFMQWEPKNHIGAGLVNGPGQLSWNELATKDVNAAKDFYEGLFGWKYEEMEMNGTGTYTIIRNGDKSNGGIREQGPAEQGLPPYWMPYFGAVSVDESAAKATELGGRVIAPPMRVPAGAFAAVADPQGAAFSLFEGDFDD